MYGIYQENFYLNLDSLESFGEYKVHNNPLIQFDDIREENPFFNREDNILLKDGEEEMNKEKETDIIQNFCYNKGEPEDLQDTFVKIQNPKSSFEENEAKKLFFVNENEQKEDKIEQNLNQNANQNQNQNKEIENKNQENAFNEKSKEIIENNIENENKKEENALMEKEKEKLSVEIKKEENIAINNNKNKIKFKVIKNTNNLFIYFYLFNPLISLVDIKSENEKSQREMIRCTIKETKKAIKENKKEIVLYSFNKEIFSVSIDKVEAIIKRKDNIRKKIKCTFLKAIIICLKNKLKRENSEIYFEGFQQSFVIKISKEKNGKSLLNMTFEELIKTDFYEEYNKKDKDKKMLNKKRELDKNPNRDKYQKNINTLKYLEENKKISDKINFEKIKKCTYRSLFEEYLESQEFEESVLALFQKGFEIAYIIEYIINAVEFIDYYSE